MIASLHGTLASKSPTEIVVDVGGISLSVTVPLTAMGKLPAAGSPVTILTHLVVREDLLQLYGFLEAEERNLFRILIAVNGIGPKMAIGILSGITVAELRTAILEGNTGMLTAIPGIGRKLADRLILELRDKLGKTSPVDPGSPSQDSPEAHTRSEAILALVSLGYSRPVAERAVRDVLLEPSSLPRSLEEIIKAALRLARP